MKQFMLETLIIDKKDNTNRMYITGPLETERECIQRWERYKNEEKSSLVTQYYKVLNVVK
jgi:hypothetical protein